MAAEIPFRVEVPDTKIALLHQKLAIATLPDELEDAGREYGASLADIRRLVARWRDGYDWRKHEAKLNAELPQFTRDIDVEGFGNLNIHYVHKKSEVVDAIPLLFVHGWPGSFLEVRKILPLLTEASNDHPSFHVVALSLPGFGFSEAPTKTGFQVPQFAEVGNKLMLSLGYNEYVTQGGDWGQLITHGIAVRYGKKHSKAYHTNYPLAPPPHPISRPFLFLYHIYAQYLGRYSAIDKAALEQRKWFFEKGNGYVHQQQTQPQTLGYGLADSPVGLLAWIYEKLINWTDEYPWDDDEVLTWISIYWFSRPGPAASLRIYKEVAAAYNYNVASAGGEPIPIPMGHSYFPREIVQLPRRWTASPNLVFEADHDKGGHFAAYEQPLALAGDLRKMFGKGGPAFSVVSGRIGYA